MPAAKASLGRPLGFTGAIALLGLIAAASGLSRRHYSLMVVGIVIIIVAVALGYSVWRAVSAARRQS
jgi:hypothetical protein